MRRTIGGTGGWGCVAVCLGGLLGGAPFASAQSYSGVVPGSSNVPDQIAATPGGAAMVTWPGFQMMPNGGSRVFVQTSVAVKPDLKREGDGYVLALPGVSLPPGNPRRPLDTHFFNTPVTSVQTKHRAGHGVTVTIHLRSNIAPMMHTERADNGYFFTYLEFPPGNYL